MKLYIITSSECDHCKNLNKLLKNGLEDDIKNKYPKLKVKKYEDKFPSDYSEYNYWKPMLLLVKKDKVISIYNAKLSKNFSTDNLRNKYDIKDPNSYLKWLSKKLD